MKLVLSKASLLDKSSKHHGEVVDILIQDGTIKQIGQSLSGDQVVDCSGKLACPGFCDLSAHYRDPGMEHQEDLSSGSRSSAFSGFTDVCLLPTTSPVTQGKSAIQYLKKTLNGVDIHPYGAVSEDCKGENLTEILDMHHAGAVAFTDGDLPIWNAELLLKALLYMKPFDGLIILRPKNIHLSEHAHMHEGHISTLLGLKGEPGISEVMSIKQSLDLLRYAGGRLHFSQISSSQGVALVRDAKAEGLRVTCDVAIHQLLYDHSVLTDYDSSFKVDPPLRSAEDRKALIGGILDDTIDAIVSAHRPLDVEEKELEFDLASPGMASIPSFIPDLLSLDTLIPLEKLIEKASQTPRSILDLPPVTLQEGQPAKICLIDKQMEWTLNESTNPSQSHNTPQFGNTLIGKCMGIINHNYHSLG